MSDDDLDPALRRTLRDVPPATASMRDAQIAAALAEMAPARRSGVHRTRILGGVAAAVMLAVAGVAVANQQQERNRGPLTAAVTTTVPKGSAECAEAFAGLWGDSRWLAGFTLNGSSYGVIQRNGAISVFMNEVPCDKKGEIEYWSSMDAFDKTTDESPEDSENCGASLDSLVEYNDRANGEPHRLVIIKTTNGIDLRFADRCRTSLGSISLP